MLSITVDTLIDFNANDGLTTLREAVAASPVGGTIDFSVTGTINLSSLGQISINKSLTISGPGANLLTINAYDPTSANNNGDGSRIFNVDDGAASVLDISISGLTLTGGDVNGHGGAVRNVESLTLSSSVVTGNAASFSGGGIGGGLYNGGVNAVMTLDSVTVSSNVSAFGGGIHNQSGTVTIANSTISGNAVTGNGGGIQNNFGTLNITASTINGNNGAGGGGGILSYYDTATNLTSTTISGNTATNGGGIWSRESDVTLASSVISGNTAGSNGGGIYQFNGNLTVTNCAIGGNNSTGIDLNRASSGAAIFNQSGNVMVTDSRITGNRATVNAGGVENRFGTVALTNTTMRFNYSNQYGGQIWNYSGNLTLTGSTLSHSSAPSGAGILNTYGTVSVNSSTISDAFAGDAGNGGGIWNYFGLLTVTRSTISGNHANNQGAGILSQTNLSAGNQGTTIEHSTISGNNAIVAGSGVFNRSGKTVIRQSTITNNNTNAPSANIADGVGSQANASTLTQVYSSIIAGNEGADDIDVVGGSFNSFQSLGYNLIGGGNAVAAFANAGDQTFANPQLRVLADNGGPTKTHLPKAGSLAIDRGDPSINPAQFDQRGAAFVRVFDGDGVLGARSDIGAVERQNPGTPQSFVVDTLSDEVDGNYSAGNFSLREAIKLANANYLVVDTISFAPALAGGTIVLRHGDLWINDPLTINGLGASQLTIDASGNDPTPSVDDADGSRIFNIDNEISLDTHISVNLSGLTLTGGRSIDDGGAILNRYENLTVTGCTISGNSGDRGGGIYSSGDLTVIGSTISGNSARRRGGGIGSKIGILTVRDSTVSGNSAHTSGGGISGAATVNNSTISGNSADTLGGGISGAATLNNSTISGNSAGTSGGGIYANGSVLNHTIVAGNIRGLSTRDDIAGTATASFSLVGDNTGATITNNGGNLIGTSASPIDPLLGPLDDNGGPTMTRALLAGSPAIDAGNPAAVPGLSGVPLHDQRGAPYTRVFNGDGAGSARIDIGAVESQPPIIVPASLIVDTLVDEDDGDFSMGDLSLREAVRLAISLPALGPITFASSLTSGGPAAILLSLGQIVINGSLTINGPGAQSLAIDASGNDNGAGKRVFNIDNGNNITNANVQITGLTLTGGDVNGPGGAIRNIETLTLRQSTISGNHASRGGAVANYRDLTIVDSTLAGNAVDLGGGAIFQDGSTLNLTNSTLSGNSARLSGGAIEADYGAVTLLHSTISGNVADADSNGSGGGGAIAIFNNPYYSVVNVELNHTIIAGNTRASGTRDDISGSIGARFSLVGDRTNANIINRGGNLLGTGGSPIDPLLGPLADNGGPTMTHALLAGSPAIDAGDPAIAGSVNVPLNDQRGAPYTRIFDGDGSSGPGIDMGAFELQVVPPTAFGDYNQNSEVDAADYVMWRKTLGTDGVPAYSGADGDGDTTIDQDDYGVWRAHFGQTLPPPAAAIEMSGATTSAAAIAPMDKFLVAVASMSLSVSEPNQFTDQFGTNNLEQVATQHKDPSPVRAPATSPFIPYRPARHASTDVLGNFAASRRDEVLVAWLASQPNPKEQFHDSGASETCENEDVSDADEVYTNTVEQVFAQLSSN